MCGSRTAPCRSAKTRFPACFPLDAVALRNFVNWPRGLAAQHFRRARADAVNARQTAGVRVCATTSVPDWLDRPRPAPVARSLVFMIITLAKDQSFCELHGLALLLNFARRGESRLPPLPCFIPNVSAPSASRPLTISMRGPKVIVHHRNVYVGVYNSPISHGSLPAAWAQHPSANVIPLIGVYTHL